MTNSDTVPGEGHTKGPWLVGYADGSGAKDGEYCITDGTKAVVVGGESFGSSHGVRRVEDARLIAAAPDLLEALHKIVNNWDDLHPKDRAQARAAIAKSQGGQP